MENTLELIDLKIHKYRVLRFWNIFLASVFSLIGTISIVFLLIYLNINLGVGYFKCFILNFVLSQIYSIVINEIALKKLDNKMNDILSEINIIKEEYKTNMNEFSTGNINNLEERYDKLSMKSKLELLTYIKDGVEVQGEVFEDSLVCSLGNCEEESFEPLPFKSGYSRKRKIENERDKRNFS